MFSNFFEVVLSPLYFPFFSLSFSFFHLLFFVHFFPSFSSSFLIAFFILLFSIMFPLGLYQYAFLFFFFFCYFFFLRVVLCTILHFVALPYSLPVCQIPQEKHYSSGLMSLIRSCLIVDPTRRPTVGQVSSTAVNPANTLTLLLCWYYCIFVLIYGCFRKSKLA